MIRRILILCAVLTWADLAHAQPFTTASGYRGIWYYNQKMDTEYVYKYSGGLGTYCAKHIPLAVYAPEVDKTFFVYGGTTPGNETLLEMVSYYDHATGEVPRPVILMDKKTTDAHDNPVISLDDAGHIWVFASSHGTSRPSYIFKSKAPYDIRDFELVLETNFSYPQPWYIEGKGFLFLHTYYKDGRGLNWSTSADGRTWTERRMLAHIDEGHYQVSWPHGEKVGTAFNYHPKGKGLNWRTNLYYVETNDMGATWRTVSGEIIATPIMKVKNTALVHDYESEGLLVYMKDLNYDAQGRPVILHLTSKNWQPGPEYGPHIYRIAHWTGSGWRFAEVGRADNNYDMGSLYIEGESWRVVAPCDVGPQAYNPGGEMAVWLSEDGGATWREEKRLTANSEYNHTYARRPLNAHPGFQAFWADGHGRRPSESRLYFWDAAVDRVMRLPYDMDSEFARPEEVKITE